MEKKYTRSDYIGTAKESPEDLVLPKNILRKLTMSMDNQVHDLLSKKKWKGMFYLLLFKKRHF
jgi:hypothetical protein